MTAHRTSLLHFSNATDRGGAEEHMLTLLNGINREYFRVAVVCSRILAEQIGPDLDPDIDVIPLALNRPTQVLAGMQFACTLRKLEVDVLHSHLFFASLFASPLGFLTRVPVVIETPHIRESWRKGLKRSYLVDRMVGRCVDHYIAVSDANARYLIEEKRLPERKVHVIHNGVNIARFGSAQGEPESLRRELGFGSNDPVLVTVARLEPQKGHRILLQSMADVVREFPSARLVCVGEGRLRADLLLQIRELKLDANIRLVGFQSKVEDWLALANFTVLPSFYEGLPLAAVESLAAGRTIVATDVDGTPEVVVHGVTGLLVRAGDQQELAASILQLLRSPDLTKRLAQAGHKRVLAKFSQQAQIARTQKLYVRALKAVGRWVGPIPEFDVAQNARQMVHQSRLYV